MEWQEFQSELVRLLQAAGVSKEDIFSIMLVLTKEEKANEMIAYLRTHTDLTPDDVRREAGRIAFSDKEETT